jgi:hypothetical protein
MGEKTSDADKKEHDGESNSGIYVMNEIPHTFDWLYLIYTLATVAAVIVSWAALITIRAQSILMKVEQRAWVSVEKPSIVDTKSSQLKIRIKLRNTGRTPAKGVVRFMEITLEKPEVRPNLAFREPVGSNTIIFPNGEIAAYQTRECDEETVNQVNSGALSIWVHGKIVYHDIFERKHWVTFCIVRVKGESFKAHTEYNAIDGERKKNFWGGISRFNKTKQT